MSRELYKKNVDKDARQELRRKKLLEEQKIRRLECQDEVRDLVEVVRPRPHCKLRNKNVNFRDFYGEDVPLQLSEWLREPPEDPDDWMILPCPKGERCIVVSGKRHCKMFNKSGRLRKCFQSGLPGGARRGNGSAVMDGIFCQEIDTFFVMDILWYGYQCFLDCEAEMRFFWLKSKFEDFEENEESNTQHKPDSWVNLKLLRAYGLDNEELSARVLQTYPQWPENRPELDGFLFYHRKSSYTSGSTPLVGWLFPFMVKDVLNLTVSSFYEPPDTYTDPISYMDAFDEQLARKRLARMKKYRKHHRRSKNEADSSDTLNRPLSQGEYNMEGIDIADESKDDRGGEDDDTGCFSLMNVMADERMLELEGVKNN